MRFSFSAVMALGSTIRISDAFVSPTFKYRTTEINMDNSFMDALSPPSGGDDDDGSEETEVNSQGSSRFQELRKLAKQEEGNKSANMQQSGRAIENPFLNSPPSTAAANPLPANPDELSVEEQARMFREMMAGNQVSASPPPPPMRVSKTDRAGRPVGRNPDADKIANTSDLYLAQLKRDSTVRTLGRQRGDSITSEAVFEDEGIKQLDDLLMANPYLKGQKDEERQLLDNLPDEVVAPYFRTDDVSASVKASSGISYKQRLMEKRKKKSGAESTPTSTPVKKKETSEVSQIEEKQPQEAKPGASSPSQVSIKQEEESDVPEASPKPPPSSQQQPSPVAPVVETPRPVSVTSSSDTRKQNLRTLMGLLLKHRGGPGFGKGRLKGPDVDLFEGLVEEITNMLRDEAKDAKPDNDMSTSQTAEVQSIEARDPAPVESPADISQPEPMNVENTVVEPQPETTPTVTTNVVPEPETTAAVAESTNVVAEPETTAVVADSVGPENIDSTIACIEGAIVMYKNSPPAIQESVLVTLRAALVSAVDTCNIALASQPPPQVAASPDASINGMIACIDGAVTMYKNCPPALKESVLVTLRMALMSAVETCNVILLPGQTTPPAVAPPVQAPPVEAPPPAPVEPPPITQSVSRSDTTSIPVTPSPTPVGEDKNSLALEEIYEKLQSASGDGKLGLRSDLTAHEASELADDLADMKSILMSELDLGSKSNKSGQAAGQESSTASRYQQMLSKARAEKEELQAGIKQDIDSTSKVQDNTAGQESSASSRYQQMLEKARAEKAKSKL